jgi:predicted DNA-binding protein
MPSKNPRLSVVLSPSLAATLASLSEATGESASGLARSILEQAEPALARMLQLVIAAKAAKGQIGGGVSESLLKVVNDLEDAYAVAESRLNRVSADLVDQAQAVAGRRRPKVASTPVPVTRGSGSPKGSTRTPRKGV